MYRGVLFLTVFFIVGSLTAEVEKKETISVSLVCDVVECQFGEPLYVAVEIKISKKKHIKLFNTSNKCFTGESFISFYVKDPEGKVKGWSSAYTRMYSTRPAKLEAGQIVKEELLILRNKKDFVFSKPGEYSITAYVSEEGDDGFIEHESKAIIVKIVPNSKKSKKQLVYLKKINYGG